MKLKVGDKTFETTKITCGKMTDYYDVLDVVEESERENGRTTKKDWQLIKEFCVNFFDNKFTTEDVDNELDSSDLMIFWAMVGKEVADKTQSKIEKLIKK